MSELTDLLIAAVVRDATDPDVALLLSGGVDSLSVGFAAARAGKRIHAYSFQLDERPSEDSLAAERAAKRFDWGFTLVKVPTANVRADFLQLAERWGCRKKTQFECAWPFLYVFPVITQRCVLTGLTADNHYGLTKECMIHYKDDKQLFDRYRWDCFNEPNPDGLRQFEALAAAHGMVLAVPYMDPAIQTYMRRFTWAELNRPREKYATLRAFRDEFQAFGVRKHANLQLVAGIPAVFEKLLADPSINTRGRARVMDMCRDHARS
jgi:asparagine synthetase B (glutamine-hydrolysing)